MSSRERFDPNGDDLLDSAAFLSLESSVIVTSYNVAESCGNGRQYVWLHHHKQ